jgi:hypothetical protein
MNIDNTIAKALLKTMMEEMSKLQDFLVDIQVEDMDMIQGKPALRLKIKILPQAGIRRS